MGPPDIEMDADKIRKRVFGVVNFLVVFEHFKSSSIAHVRDFFANEYKPVEGDFIGVPSPEYREIRDAYKREFEACLRWYAEMDVFSERDVAVALEFVEYRNLIAHEPARVIMGNRFRGWALNRAKRLRRKMDSFWIGVNVDIDPDIPGDYDRDRATSIFRMLTDHIEASLELLNIDFKKMKLTD